MIRMAVKFLEITEDPYTNNSNLFILILSIADLNTPTPSSPGNNSVANGNLVDPGGNPVGYMWVAFYQDYEVTGSLSDEAFSHSWTQLKNSVLVPPGYKFSGFTRATALQGTLEELAPFIRGM